MRRLDVILVMAVLVALTQPAHAYLDASTGSAISQLFLGGMAGWMLLACFGINRLFSKLARNASK
ncbi:MAG: hypothetical protein FJX76_24720 [Armatimonadetes bacterium]|nr:hypothetical protein [Armatimonadota bacterium]